MSFFRKVAGLAALAASVNVVLAQSDWTGQGSSLNWSDSYNWSTYSAPDPWTALYFEDLFYSTGYTNVPGVVNNIVNQDFSVGAAVYNATYPASNANTNNSHFYTTLIPAGVTLTLGGLGENNGALIAGDIPDLGFYVEGNYATLTTITGPGALVVNEPAGFIYAGLATPGGNSMLDLSGLNTFRAVVRQFRVFANNDQSQPYGTSPFIVKLAATNTITTSPNLQSPGVLILCVTNLNPTAQLWLGQTNSFNTDVMVIGGLGAGPANGRSYMQFNTNYPGGSFRLRGSDSVSPIAYLSIGDASVTQIGMNNDSPIGWSSPAPTVDLSGGTVDILADSIYIGRSASSNTPCLDSSKLFNSAKAISGTLVLGAGIIRATNVYCGYRNEGGTNNSYGNGTLTLLSNTTMEVVGNFYLGYRTNNSFPGSLVDSGNWEGTGILSVNNGSVLTVGGNLIRGLTGGPFSFSVGSVINVSNATINLGGLVFMGGSNDTINVSGTGRLNMGGSLAGNATTAINLAGGGNLNLTSGGNLAIGVLTGSGYITNAGSIVVSNLLNPGVVGSGDKESLFLGTNLNLASVSNLTFDLSPNPAVGSQVNDYIKVSGNVNFNSAPIPLTLNFSNGLAAGTYALMDYGSYSGSTPTFSYPTRASVLVNNTGHELQLIVSNLNLAANLTWKGSDAAGGDTWDVAASSYWLNGASAAQFYQFDNVTFDDTGLTNTITVATTVQPGSVTFDNSIRNYSISGASAMIVGPGGLTKNGTAPLSLNSANDFNGPVHLNAGVTTIGNAGAFGTRASTASTVTIAANAALDLGATGIGSTKSGRKYTIQGSGVNNSGVIFTTNDSVGGTYALCNSGISLINDATITMTNSVSRGTALVLQGMSYQTSPAGNYGVSTPLLDLGGKTLTIQSAASGILISSGGTTFSTGAVSIAAMLITNGSINVASGTLLLGNNYYGPAFVDGAGPGKINLADNTILRFSGYNTSAGATGYVAKAINVVSNASLVSLDSQYSPYYDLPISGSVTIGHNGTLTISNGRPNTGNANAMTISGVIQDAGNGSLVKNGTGRLTLNAPETYTGPTIINDGGLTVGSNASFMSSFIQFASGSSSLNTLDCSAKSGGLTLTQPLIPPNLINGSLNLGNHGSLIGNTTINGSLATVSGAEVAPGGTNLLGSIVVSNNLTLGGGHFTWEVAPSFGVSDQLVAGGNLALSGMNTFKINSIGGFSPDGTNTLITYSGSLVSGGLANLAIVNPDVRFVVQFIDPATTPGKIQVRLTTPPAGLVWQGNDPTHPTWWDVKTTTNWVNGATPDKFWNADDVTFDDSGTTSTVDLVSSSAIGPDTITLNNNSLGYLFRGAPGLVTGAITNNGNGGLVISNNANNAVVGAGLVLNTGTITFSQPTNATLTALLLGGGTLAKSGTTNSLTVVSADSSGFHGSVQLNSGRLICGSSNTFGNGSLTIFNGATLDLNGQVGAGLSSVTVSGTGLNGLGAIDNSGAVQTNALSGVNLTGNTTLGAVSNRWDIGPGAVYGNNFNLTKSGANDIWIHTGSETYLETIDILAGRLVFSDLGTTLGDSSANIIIRTNGTLGFANGIQAGNKNVAIQAGGALFANGYLNGFAGNITMTNGAATNCTVWTDPNAQLTLAGSLSGPARLNLASSGTVGTSGQLTLSGTNTYTGGTLVTDGILEFANTRSFVGTNIVLRGRMPYFNGPAAGVLLDANIVSPTNLVLDMETSGVNGPTIATLNGDGGTWAGPILMNGSSSQGSVIFATGYGGLAVNGPIYATNFAGVSPGGFVVNGDMADVTTLQGGAITLNSRLTLKGTLLCKNWQNLFGLTKLVLNASSNSWASATFYSGMIQIGADNAIPPQAPLTVAPNLFPGGDHRFILDLNGHDQALVNFNHQADNVVEQPVWFGNSSPIRDSTLTYAGTGSNTWSLFLLDAFDTSAPVQHKTGLTVSSGYLRYVPSGLTDASTYANNNAGPVPGPISNTFSGPTLVTGGTFDMETSIPNSPVTVSGAGTLMGNGTLGGPVVVNPGGTLAPGTGTNGILTIANNLTLNAGALCRFRVNLAAGWNDQVFGIANLHYGGTLLITNISPGHVYTNGQVIKLFDAATYQGSFSSIVFPGATSYDATKLTVDGTIEVLSTVSTAPASITSSVVGGNNLQLAWPYDHTGWRLQTQTNRLNAGLSSIWYDVPGSSATNQMTLPIVTTNPTVFYRIVYP